MKFYSALQMNPGALKAAIAGASDTREKRFYQRAMLVRAVLIVAFSILLIAPIAPVFGAENSAVGVVLVCVLLSVRFVDFGYCIGDSVVNTAAAFALLWLAPALAGAVHPAAALAVHFAALLLLFLMTSDRPELGNGGLYAFSYIFLSGNPVSGALFWKRGLLLALGWALCAAILAAKHRTKHREVRFFQLVRSFRLSDAKCRWQLQFALGLALLLAVGSWLQMERLMWAGFACASLLGCYSSDADTHTAVKERFGQRVTGAALGSLLFALLYRLVPVPLHGLFGPVGGLCLGYCASYRYKTVFNCFGALLLAAGVYGVQGSVLLRIVSNLAGAAFGYGFFMLCRALTAGRAARAA